MSEETQNETKKITLRGLVYPTGLVYRKKKTRPNEIEKSIVSLCDTYNKALKYSLIHLGRLNKIFSKNFNNELQCESKNIDKTNVNVLGEGAFNTVYDIGENRVLRITKEDSSSKDSASDNALFVKLGIVDKNSPFIEEDIRNMELLGCMVQMYLSSEKGCNCNYICKVYDIGYSNKDKKGGGVYSILEKVPHEMAVLQEHFQKVRFLSEYNKNKYIQKNNNHILAVTACDNNKVKRIFFEILQAIKCMQFNRYVHIDIKPANIGLSKEMNVKIYDFGSSRHVDNYYLYPTKKELDATTEFYEDPYYEKSGHILHLNFDIYSVGVMLIEFFFYCEKISNLNCKIPVNPLYYEHMTDDDVNLKNLIENMINHDPNKRYNAEKCLEHIWFDDIRTENELQELKLKQQSKKLFMNRKPLWSRSKKSNTWIMNSNKSEIDDNSEIDSTWKDSNGGKLVQKNRSKKNRNKRVTKKKRV
jgi:serine/threonine protein kinase